MSNVTALHQASPVIMAGEVPVKMDQIASIKLGADGSTELNLRQPDKIVAGLRFGPDMEPSKTMAQLDALGSFLGGPEGLGIAKNTAQMHAESLGKPMDVATQNADIAALLQAAANENSDLAAKQEPAPAPVTHTAHAGKGWVNDVVARREESKEPGGRTV